jgi:hypothetical protein
VVRAARAAVLLSILVPEPSWAQGALEKHSIVDYLKKRDDLTSAERARWISAAKKRFGGAAIEDDVSSKPEVAVAKAILSAAIIMRAKPEVGAQAAWEGWRGALGYVPPPIAIHYQILSLEGRKPRGRPLDLAFKFPDYYVEEIAPDLVAYWEDALDHGKVPDAALKETQEALEATRLKMRPLLLDKIRLLARLDRDLAIEKGVRKAELEQDMGAIQAELEKSFTKVARRPEVLNPKKRPFDRLRIQLEDMGLPLGEEDRYLDPDSPPPPKKAVPKMEEPPPSETPDTEPELPPLPDLPDQRRPGDPTALQSTGDLVELIAAYGRRVKRVVADWIGTPYRFGSDRKTEGTDCSGFTQRIFSEAFAFDLPRISIDQYRVGVSVRLDDLRPGDLLFFDLYDLGKVGHVGIYAGDGKFAHASTSRGVVYDELASRYFKRAFRGARRVLAYPR